MGRNRLQEEYRALTGQADALTAEPVDEEALRIERKPLSALALREESYAPLPQLPEESEPSEGGAAESEPLPQLPEIPQQEHGPDVGRGVESASHPAVRRFAALIVTPEIEVRGDKTMSTPEDAESFAVVPAHRKGVGDYVARDFSGNRACGDAGDLWVDAPKIHPWVRTPLGGEVEALDRGRKQELHVLGAEGSVCTARAHADALNQIGVDRYRRNVVGGICQRQPHGRGGEERRCRTQLNHQD